MVAGTLGGLACGNGVGVGVVPALGIRPAFLSSWNFFKRAIISSFDSNFTRLDG